mmetsp:Transcript_89789/g.159648  ORF Transcript_89789/g.159648 Transcript_89789/m.159648 type:complete len:445 (-) Transcript_89789:105-1439(-)
MDSGEEVEGDEDWRYGPLGRAGAPPGFVPYRPPKKDPVLAQQPLPQPPLQQPAQELSDNDPPRSFTGEVRPRTIWAYWAQGHQEMPEFFKMCVATWQRLNPHWDVRILQKSTVHEYLSLAELPNRFMDMTSHQTASDAVRLGVLSRYGGVWADVNILMCGSLDKLCWNAIRSGEKSACIFFHPFYGTEALGGEDFVESWFLATGPNNPFFIRWRDTFRELFHNRLDIDGLLNHPMYQGLDLSGFERLNRTFSGSGMEFREYLAIHAMSHRLLETDPVARAAWRDNFIRIDAANTAFRVQLAAEASNLHAAQVLLVEDPRADELLEGVPFIKFRTPDYGPLMALSRPQLGNRKHLLGRLLDPPDAARSQVRCSATATTFGSLRASTCRGGRHMVAASLAVVCMAGRLCGLQAQPRFGVPTALGCRAVTNRPSPGRWLPAFQASLK